MDDIKSAVLDDSTQQAAITAQSQVIAAMEWKNSVVRADLTTPPGSPATGARYIVATGGTAAWSTKDTQVAIWSGTAWTFEVPTEGASAYLDATDTVIFFNGTAWIGIGLTHTHPAATGTSAPATAPAFVGQMFVDTAAKKPYFGAGVATSADWVKPAPAAHNLVDTTGHAASGLTNGHFMKATGATTYAFGAHGLAAADVGAMATPSTGTAGPAIVPSFIGQMFIDTSAKKAYIACGAAAEDWKEVTNAL